ncbi:MAG: TolC family outer membrane protein [Pseudomonadota bacterium]
MKAPVPGTFTHLLRTLTLGVLLASPLVTQIARADDLQQVFDLAVQNDPEIRGARARYNASHTVISQGRSYLLPTVSASASRSRDTQGLASAHSFGNSFPSKSYGLNLRQALVNFQAWYAYQSARIGDQSAALTLAQSEQQLIVKVATAYFNVLRSKANLASFEAEEQAALQVLEQTRQRFDVGLVAITDVYDSQASADLASVNKLVEENNLSQSLEALEAITGQPHMDIADLNPEFPIAPVDPASLSEWVRLGQENNLAVKIASLDLDAKEQDAKATKAAAWPTLDLSANYNWRQSTNPFTFFPSAASEGSSIALNFSLPLYAGGLNRARTRQAYYTRDASEEALLKSQRDNTQGTRNAYRSVETDVKAVAARAQAIVSAQSALEATQVGAEVGTRNIVDIVLSQRLLFQTQRDHSNAKFNYIIDTLELKQAAGVLSPEDVIELNQWLQE